MSGAEQRANRPKPSPARNFASFETLEERTVLSAQVFSFDIDAARSFLTLIGSLTALGSEFHFQSQAGPGGDTLTTTLDGSVRAEVAGTTIRFENGGTIEADELSDAGVVRLFLPPVPGGASAAPADFAAFIAAGADAVLRGLVIDVDSGPLAIGPGGALATNLVFTVDAGRVDFSVLGFRFSADLAGSTSAGAATGLSRVTFGPDTVELAVPIDFELTAVTDLGILGTVNTSLRFVGSFVAVASLADEGEPNDSFATATPIAPIANVVGNISGPTDVDIFLVELTESGRLMARVGPGNTGSQVPLLALFDSEEVLLKVAVVDGMGGRALLADLPAGTYFLQLLAGLGSSGLDAYRLQTEFASGPADGSPGEGVFDPDQFVPITIDLFGLQVGTFLFVKDMFAAFQQAQAAAISPSMFIIPTLPSDLSSVTTLSIAFPIAGKAGSIPFTPASPLSPISIFAVRDRAVGSLAPLPTVGLADRGGTRLAEAIARFGGGASNPRTTSDGTAPAVPANAAVVEPSSAPKRASDSRPANWADLIDKALDSGAKNGAGAPRTPLAPRSDRDASSGTGQDAAKQPEPVGDEDKAADSSSDSQAALELGAQTVVLSAEERDDAFAEIAGLATIGLIALAHPGKQVPDRESAQKRTIPPSLR